MRIGLKIKDEGLRREKKKTRSQDTRYKKKSIALEICPFVSALSPSDN